MNQRILSCPSTLLTKGLTIKTGDWKTSDATTELLDVNKMKRTPDSAASLPNGWKLTRNNSSSSFLKQSVIQRTSSSNLSQAKTDRSYNLSSNSSMGNASWDDKVFGVLTPKKTGSRRTSVNLLDLVQRMMDDQVKEQQHRAESNAFPAVSGTGQVTSARQRRRLSTIVDMSSPEEEEEPVMTHSFLLKSTPFHEKDDGNANVSEILSISQTREDDNFLVKTFNEKAPKQNNMQRISSSDMVSMKEKDPFMYYSIPAVRAAALHGNDVDLQAVKDAATSSLVRKTCLSVESWFIPGLNDTDIVDLDSCGLPSVSNTFYNMNMGMDDNDEEDIDDDWLYSFSGIQAAKKVGC
ncbi:hypothetical protein ACHAWX_000793 [Stephanocyclus meneghinianus]